MDHPHAQPESPDEDLRALFRRTAPETVPTDLEALFAQAEASRSIPAHRRLVMTIRFTAAAAAIGAAALLLFSSPRASSASFGLAEVQQRVTATQTVTLTQVDSLNGKSRESMKLLFSGPNLVRAEFEGGYSVSDFKAKKVMIVDAKRKHAQIMEGTAFPVPEAMNFYTLIRDAAKNPTKTLPERQIDGRRALGFIVTLHDHEATVWADAESRLPIRIDQTIKEGQDVSEQVMRDIVFDRPLAASLFRFDPPEGYAVETVGVPTLAAPPEDAALAAPTILPRVGLGPARFGMTPEEAAKALGKPDREFVQGGVTFLAYYSRGFELSFLPPAHARHGLNRASCFGQHGFALKVREFQGKTDKGIGLGATRDDVIKAYGPPNFEHVSRMKDVIGEKAAHPDEPTGQSEVQYNDLGISFTMYQGKIYNISISAPRPPAAAKK